MGNEYREQMSPARDKNFRVSIVQFSPHQVLKVVEKASQARKKNMSLAMGETINSHIYGKVPLSYGVYKKHLLTRWSI